MVTVDPPAATTLAAVSRPIRCCRRPPRASGPRSSPSCQAFPPSSCVWTSLLAVYGQAWPPNPRPTPSDQVLVRASARPVSAANAWADPQNAPGQGRPRTVITRAGAYVAPVDVTDDVPSPSESAGGPFNLVVPAGLDMQARPGVTPGQIAGNCATCDFSGGSVAQRDGKSRMFRAEARRCLIADGAIKMVNLVRDHHVDRVAPLGHTGTRSNVRPRPARRQIPAAAA